MRLPHVPGLSAIRPAGGDRPLPELRREIAATGRRLAAAGLVHGTNGNISARAGELVAVTPTGAALVDLEDADVAVVTLGGEHVAGRLAPTSELALHLGIYGRYDTGAVVHTHAPMATALSCVLDEVPCVHYEMLSLGGTVRVAPYSTFGTPELAGRVVAALEDRLAVLMANHGTAVHASDLATAVRLTELLEWACTLYWRAAQIGTPRALDAAERDAVAAAAAARDYGRPPAAAG